jgi:hypothetical protein
MLQYTSIFSFYLLLSWCGKLLHLQNFLQYIIIEFISSIFLLFTPPPILQHFQQFSFFHLHKCVHNIGTMFTLLHPLSHPPLPLVPISQAHLFCKIKAKEFVEVWGYTRLHGQHRQLFVLYVQVAQTCKQNLNHNHQHTHTHTQFTNDNWSQQ